MTPADGTDTPQVRRHQVWVCHDPRQPGRRFRVLEVVDEFPHTSRAQPYAVVAYLDTGRQTRIRLDRFRATRRSGYRLVDPVPDPAPASGPAEPAAAPPPGAARPSTAAPASASAVAPSFGPVQAAREVGVTVWQWEAGQRHGLIPPQPDRPDGRWSPTAIARVRARLPEISAVTADGPPVGVTRTAERLAARTGLPVDAAVIATLAEHEVLVTCGDYKDRPLYDPVAVDAALAAAPELLEQLVAERQRWLHTSVRVHDAATQLGWARRELDGVLTAQCLRPDPEGRISHEVVDALGGDEDLGARVLADRRLGPHRAAEHLEIRHSDLRHLVRAGLLHAVSSVEVRFGRRRVDVPLYRIGDLDTLRAAPPAGVDWDAVRACRPGDRSPLRDLYP